MFFTSVGPTTELLQEHLLELGRSVGRLANLNILMVADGWIPFTRDDGVPLRKRLEQRIDNAAARSWTNDYLEFLLSDAMVTELTIGELDDDQFGDAADRAGMLLLPGSNTFQLMRGLCRHKDAIRERASKGLIVVGDSAGPSASGVNTEPASLKPADTKPKKVDVDIETGLGLIQANIITHAPGRKGGFDLPGSRMASLVLRSQQTSNKIVQAFIAESAENGIECISLHDKEGLRISGGEIIRVA